MARAFKIGNRPRRQTRGHVAQDSLLRADPESGAVRHIPKKAAGARRLRTKNDRTENPINSLPRVFVIGFNRCGTRTIHWYFKSNGHNAVHWDGGNLADTIFGNLMASLPLLAGYESFSVFSDMERIANGLAVEAYKLYDYLDISYPNSVFILNTRDADAWIRSRLAAGNGGYARRWKYFLKVQSDEELVSLWRQDWNMHHRNVERYFSGKPSRFLKFNIETDEPEKINQLVPEYDLDPDKYMPRGRGRRRS